MSHVHIEPGLDTQTMQGDYFQLSKNSQHGRGLCGVEVGKCGVPAEFSQPRFCRPTLMISTSPVAYVDNTMVGPPAWPSPRINQAVPIWIH